MVTQSSTISVAGLSSVTLDPPAGLAWMHGEQSNNDCDRRYIFRDVTTLGVDTPIR
jgi:hypothetical protein